MSASLPPDREPDDQTGVLWRDDAALAAGPLTRGNVLDYFARSPFYDAQCNNELLRARGLGLDSLNLMPAGPEYVLVDAREPYLFVIRRQLRGAPGAPPTPQALYYILDGSVYQAPPLGAVLASRVDRCLWSMRTAFNRVQADLDPLARDAAAADADVAAAAGPPPRRYTDAERERARTGDRIVTTVLAGLGRGPGGVGSGGSGVVSGLASGGVSGSAAPTASGDVKS